MLKTQITEYWFNIPPRQCKLMEDYFKKDIITIFKENNFSLIYENGEIGLLDFIKPSYTGEEICFFNKIAKYVNKGSYIMVEGDHNGNITHWKYEFDGFKCLEIDID